MFEKFTDNCKKLNRDIQLRKLLKFSMRILYFRVTLGEHRVEKLLSRTPIKCTILQRSCQKFERKTDRGEWKQKEPDANFNLISEPNMRQLLAVPTKLSRSEIEHFE